MRQEKDLISLEHFMASTQPVTEPASFRVQLSSLERPLWWAMERLGLAGDGHVSASYEQRWKSAQGSFVHLEAVKARWPLTPASLQIITRSSGGC